MNVWTHKSNDNKALSYEEERQIERKKDIAVEKSARSHLRHDHWAQQSMQYPAMSRVHISLPTGIYMYINCIQCCPYALVTL